MHYRRATVTARACTDVKRISEHYFLAGSSYTRGLISSNVMGVRSSKCREMSHESGNCNSTPTLSLNFLYRRTADHLSPALKLARCLKASDSHSTRESRQFILSACSCVCLASLRKERRCDQYQTMTLEGVLSG